MHHNVVELKARNVAQHSWESMPILNGEQPEAVKDIPMLHWTNLDASPELIPQLLCRIQIYAY